MDELALRVDVDLRLRQELEAARRIAHSVPMNLSLVVDRLVVVPSGVMLLLLRPAASGAPACVDSLRAAAADAFRTAAHKQTSGLIHTSLLRTLSLSADFFGANASIARSVNALVERWSARLQGMHAQVGGLLYVRETQIISQ